MTQELAGSQDQQLITEYKYSEFLMSGWHRAQNHELNTGTHVGLCQLA